MGSGKSARELPEHAVHGHQVVGLPFRAHVADARPLRVPAVGAVVAVAGFGQAVEVPAALSSFAYAQQQGFMVPARGPDGIGIGVGVAIDAAGAGYLDELVAAHHFPVVAVPFGQGPRLDVEALQRLRSGLAVVAVYQHALSAVQPLAVRAGQQHARGIHTRVVAPLPAHIGVFVEQGHRQGMDVHLVEALLHGAVVDLAGRVTEVPGVAGVASRHLIIGYGAHHAGTVDDVGTDEELAALAVDHAVGRRAADALGAHDLLQVGCDLVELVGGAVGQVRSVGDHPESVRPGHHGARAAFILVVVICQVGVDAAEA